MAALILAVCFSIRLVVLAIQGDRERTSNAASRQPPKKVSATALDTALSNSQGALLPSASRNSLLWVTARLPGPRSMLRWFGACCRPGGSRRGSSRKLNPEVLDERTSGPQLSFAARSGTAPTRRVGQMEARQTPPSAIAGTQRRRASRWRKSRSGGLTYRKRALQKIRQNVLLLLLGW